MAWDFLTRWPTLEKLQKTKPGENSQVLSTARCRNRNLIDERLKQIRAAIPLTQDPAVVETSI